jgi:hypothetical protein
MLKRNLDRLWPLALLALATALPSCDELLNRETELKNVQVAKQVFTLPECGHEVFSTSVTDDMFKVPGMEKQVTLYVKYDTGQDDTLSVFVFDEANLDSFINGHQSVALRAESGVHTADFWIPALARGKYHVVFWNFDTLRMVPDIDAEIRLTYWGYK